MYTTAEVQGGAEVYATSASYDQLSNYLNCHYIRKFSPYILIGTIFVLI